MNAVSWWPFSPPSGGKDKHQEGNNKNNAMLQHWKGWMLIEIKEYAKPIKHQLEVHMEYDGKNKDAINPNGKYQQSLWM